MVGAAGPRQPTPIMLTGLTIDSNGPTLTSRGQRCLAQRGVVSDYGFVDEHCVAVADYAIELHERPADGDVSG